MIPRVDLERLLRAAARSKSTPEVRALAQRAANELDAMPRPEFHRTARLLVESGARNLAYELYEARRERVRELRAADVEALGAGLASWGGVDCFAYFVAGPAWREGRITDARVARWARSDDEWRRRLALVSTVPLNVENRGGSGDSRRTLAVCARLVDDRVPSVVKALSWALRALVPRDRAAVERFLARNDARIAPSVRREVVTKLRTGRKR